jgi:hypothetical protein
MALYKYAKFLDQSNHEAFDKLHSPGVAVPYSGLYRCEVCGHEIVSTYGNTLPPQNHHQHSNRQPIQWRLTVTHTSQAT